MNFCFTSQTAVARQLPHTVSKACRIHIPLERSKNHVKRYGLGGTSCYCCSFVWLSLSVEKMWLPCRLVPALTKWKQRMRGVTIHFPFKKPLVPQIQMMQKIMLCLKEKKHGLLESPTGTGKTAALLCAALAWQRHNDQEVCWNLFAISHSLPNHMQGLESKQWKPSQNLFLHSDTQPGETDLEGVEVDSVQAEHDGPGKPQPALYQS